MKKRLILAALLSVGVLVGCGNTGSSSEPSSEAPSSEVSSEASSESSSEEAKINWGTAEAPLSIAEVAEICKNFTNDDHSKEKGYVTGVVKTAPTPNQYGSYEFYLEGGDINFQVYSAKLATGVSQPKIGDTIVVYGYFKKFYEKYEVAYIKSLNDSPSIISVVAGSTTPDTPDTPDTPVSAWGTQEAPLTVSQAMAAMSSASTDASTTFEAGFVTGNVESITYNSEYSNYTIYLNDGFQLYGATVNTGVDVPSVGDTVIASGTFKKHYKTCELDKGCKVVSTTHNNYAISLSVVDGNGTANAQLATVTGLAENALSGSTQTFTVVPSTGNKIGSVTVSGSVIEANQDGSYSFVVSSANAVKVEIVGENEAAPVVEELAVIAKQGVLNGKSISWTGTNVKVTNNQDKSTTAIRTQDADHHRIYAKSQVVVELTSGTEIKEVKFTCVSAGSYATVLSEGATAAGYTASVNGQTVTVSGITGTSITFNVSAQTRINSVAVTYKA